MPIVKQALLAPVPGSGVSAQLTFVESDDGTTLTVTGTATGMQPLGTYVSLVYGLQSNADVTPPFTPPGPCVDDQTLGVVLPPGTVTPGGLLFDAGAMSRMFLGVWQAYGSSEIGVPLGSERTLNVTKPCDSPAGVHLSEVNTVSIRQVDPGLNSFSDFRPQSFRIQACGQIM